MNDNSKTTSDCFEVNASLKGDPYRVEYHLEGGFVVVYLNTQDRTHATVIARRVANLHVPEGYKVGKRWWTNGGKGYGYCFFLVAKEAAA